MPGWAVAMTLMATLIGSGTLIGHPATVFQSGMILLLGNMTLPLVLIFVARYIVPFYRRVVGMSAYEYIGQRFGIGGRLYSSIGFVADRLFDIGVTLITTAIPVKIMTGWSLGMVILCIGGFTVIYTMVGGIEGVVWTSVVQGFIFIGAAIYIVLRLVFAPEAGPAGTVVTAAWEAGKFNLGSFEFSWRSLFDAQHSTQWLIIFAFLVNWGRRYIADQHMVQRYLIARSDREASSGAFWNAWLCVPIYMTFMFIGACLYGFYKTTGNPPPALVDTVMPEFIAHFTPTGILGLFLAAVLSASMSSISADVNSVATVITTDHFGFLFPKASDHTRLMFGRAMVIVGGILACAVAWMLIPDKGSASVMERAVTIAAILSGGTLGLFFLGFLTKRATRPGCYVGIVACLLFTAWGILTEPKNRIVDMGFNFEMNPILIGLVGHVVLFVVGYVASLILGGYRPANIDELTFRRVEPTAAT